MRFKNFSDIRAVLANLPDADAAASAGAVERNAQLTKPPSALGRLEELAIWFAGWRGDPRPELAAPAILIFAGNHGVAARGVSAFPAEVTAQMVASFAAGGAAINQLARTFGATLDVVPLTLDRPTADFTRGPAMTELEMAEAFSAGWAAMPDRVDLLVTGEMGIGNTTAAAAVACALWGGEAADWVGRGTGVDDAGLARKTEAVSLGLGANPDRDPFAVLAALGGRELAAMAGAILHARVRRVPVILDGFICTAAASVLEKARSGALDHAVAGHKSAEAAHARLLSCLGKQPLLALDLRLGEGSGAALALGVLQGAIACHFGMATFAEAGVADG